MSKTKMKSHNETNHFKGIIRDLQKQVRQLQRQLKYFEKRNHLNELPEPDVEIQESILVTEMRIVCTNPTITCHGVYDELPLGEKVYGNCSSCGHNKRLK